ncbi:MAG: ATP-binding protein [Methylococcales bacterium]|nr:ATP-binding protein [Methylococcales bacterium]
MSRARITLPVSFFLLLLLALVLFSLHLMSSATQATSELNPLYSWLLLINVLGSVALLVLIGINIVWLWRQLKQRAAGSLLTRRMVSLFVVLALAPALIVYYFSMQFLHQSIDSWFNVEIDRAMEDSLELSQASLDQRMRWRLEQTQGLARRFHDKTDSQALLTLDSARAEAGASELTLFSRQARVLASSSVNPSEIIPLLPDELVWLQLKQRIDYVALDTRKPGQLRIQVVTRVASTPVRYIQALYPVPVRIADLADSVEFAFVRYQEMHFLRDSLKMSFSLTLSLVLLLSLLAAIWVAFISIRTMVAPVKALVKGTRAVAAGDYEQQLPVLALDDLGFLVQSFNAMARRLAMARDETHAAGLEVENQRAYLETILANLTTGVISFDAGYRIRTANQAAYRIFHVPVSQFVGQTLPELATEHPDLLQTLTEVQQLLTQAESIWERRIDFNGPNGRQELLCRGTPLYSQDGRNIGAVAVFDDVTDLIQAQKNAAWGEVARRLAHEIKNPLTPIQLSAERLHHKLAEQVPKESLPILERSTQTIVQQVKALKAMVDDFSLYARSIRRQVERIALPVLVKEVMALYALPGKVRFTTRFANETLEVLGDPVALRQVLHNLIKNAQEAAGHGVELTITIRRSHQQRDWLEWMVVDNGPGLSEEQREKVFEPYVTTKVKGTGLGLAIVKKIIEEHGGLIWLAQHPGGGACFVIQLPLATGMD